MLTPIANVHHSKLPKPGEIGYITNGYERYTGNPLYWHGRRQRYIVESYHLCDNVRPYSIGIHLVTLRNLRNGERVTVSGFYFKTIEEL